MRKPPQPYTTDLFVNGIEFSASVFFDYELLEYNWGERICVNEVWCEDQGDKVDDLTDKEMKELESEIMEYVCNWYADDYEARGDWLRDCRKDDKLTGDA